MPNRRVYAQTPQPPRFYVQCMRLTWSSVGTIIWQFSLLFSEATLQWAIFCSERTLKDFQILAGPHSTLTVLSSLRPLFELFSLTHVDTGRLLNV